MGLLLFLIILAILLGGLGFSVHVLWILAIAVVCFALLRGVDMRI